MFGFFKKKNPKEKRDLFDPKTKEEKEEMDILYYEVLDDDEYDDD